MWLRTGRMSPHHDAGTRPAPSPEPQAGTGGADPAVRRIHRYRCPRPDKPERLGLRLGRVSRPRAPAPPRAGQAPRPARGSSPCCGNTRSSPSVTSSRPPHTGARAGNSSAPACPTSSARCCRVGPAHRSGASVRRVGPARRPSTEPAGSFVHSPPRDTGDRPVEHGPSHSETTSSAAVEQGMGKRLGDGVDVAGELGSIRIVCRIDLREDERTRPG